MASIGAFVVGASMTGGFAYGIYDLRKNKKTGTTKYKGFIAGLVIGIVILVMAMFMGGMKTVQMNGGLGGPTDQQMTLMTSDQLQALEASTRNKIGALQTLIGRLAEAIEKAKESEAAQELLKGLNNQ